LLVVVVGLVAVLVVVRLDAGFAFEVGWGMGDRVWLVVGTIVVVE
jgi:hypothetical protein